MIEDVVKYVPRTSVYEVFENDVGDAPDSSCNESGSCCDAGEFYIHRAFFLVLNWCDLGGSINFHFVPHFLPGCFMGVSSAKVFCVFVLHYIQSYETDKV